MEEKKYYCQRASKSLADFHPNGQCSYTFFFAYPEFAGKTLVGARKQTIKNTTPKSEINTTMEFMQSLYAILCLQGTIIQAKNVEYCFYEIILQIIYS